MGEVFAGRYELVDPIGRGGVGAVWRAWDHRRRRYVAAKVLQQRDAHSLLRFVRGLVFLGCSGLEMMLGERLTSRELPWEAVMSFERFHNAE